ELRRSASISHRSNTKPASEGVRSRERKVRTTLPLAGSGGGDRAFQMERSSSQDAAFQVRRSTPAGAGFMVVLPPLALLTAQGGDLLYCGSRGTHHLSASAV